MPLRLSVFFVYFYEALLATHVNSYMHRPSAQRSGGSLSRWRTCQIPALSLLCPCGFKRNSLLFQHSNGDLSIGVRVHDVYRVITCRPGRGHIVAAARLQLVLSNSVALSLVLFWIPSPLTLARPICRFWHVFICVMFCNCSRFSCRRCAICSLDVWQTDIVREHHRLMPLGGGNNIVERGVYR